MMEQLISALKQFDARNNISASIIVNSDGSCGVMEFWTEEDLGEFKSVESLLKFLYETQYELDAKGICISPCKIK
jgi:hypothetical protein